MKKVSLFALAVAICLASSAVTKASLYLTQADLLAMTIESSANAAGTETMTAGPGAGAYSDSAIRVMSGLAGSRGDVEFSPTGSVYYTAGSYAGAADTLVAIGYNDNDDNWTLGLWYAATSGGAKIETSASVAPMGGLHAFTLALPGPVDDYGVFIRNDVNSAGEGDRFHVSWETPEPTSFLIWGGLAMVGTAVRRRRRS